MNLTNIQNRLTNNKWAMEKKTLYSFYNTIDSLMNLRAGGLYGKIFGNPLPVSKALNNEIISTSEPVEESQGDISVIVINGILSKGCSLEEQELLGMVDTNEISFALDTAAGDPSIKMIILSFVSPGGETAGITELGKKIRNIDENIKPVYAWNEKTCASAAAWLASQCRAIGQTETSTIGSCGVYMLVIDASQKYKNDGINVQAISSGKYKMMGHDNKPLSDEEMEILQNDVNQQHETFKNTVKSNRPNIKDEALEGLSYEGQKALEMGWVDMVTDDFNSFVSEITK